MTSQMIRDCCPIPSKKQRKLVSSTDTSDNEELNLSSSFDENYQNLMKEEMIAICLKQYNTPNDKDQQNIMFEFLKKCDDLQIWIETVLLQSRKQPLCRCDSYLEKICHSRQLFQSSRFTSIKIMSNLILSQEPHLQDIVNSKIQDIENQWHSRGLFTDLTICHVLDDIDEDIADLVTWLNDVKQKLNFGITSSNRKLDQELLEYILRDFEIHNDVSMSVMKVINELQEMSPRSSYYDRVMLSKSSMFGLESDIYQQWLNVIEEKLKLEGLENDNSNIPSWGLPGTIGQESGFESELSPMYNVRKLCLTSNHKIMSYISSCDDSSDCTTELPSDSQSADLIPIDRPYFSSSIQNMSTEVTPVTSNNIFISSTATKRVIRRKKRRSKRTDKMNQFNLSTEESESFRKSIEKSSLKRRINESSRSQEHNVPVNPLSGLNYSEIANVAEQLVRKNSSRAEYLSFESPKESEIEDIIDTTKSNPNDIDVEKNWDYYQAAMYSNEEGDSQILEIDCIKDWEPELDTDGLEVIMAPDNSPKILEKRLSMLTSGYETNMESDPTICSKVLICVLQFTTSHYQEVDNRINDLTSHSDDVFQASFDALLTAMTDCASKADIHLKLLRKIIDYDPCTIAHNSTLIDNLKVMENRWDRIKSRCIVHQLDLIEGRIESFDEYTDVDGLKYSIECVQGLMAVVNRVKNGLSRSTLDSAKIAQRINDIKETLSLLKKVRVSDLDVVLRCQACVAQSKCTRRLFACELHLSKEPSSANNIDVKNLYDKFETCIISLKKCMDDVTSLSSTECQTSVSGIIDQEIKSWKKLCEGATDSMRPSLASITAEEEIECLEMAEHGQIPEERPRCTLFRRLPIHMAIFVVVAMIGWWYSQSSTTDCQSSLSSTDWIRMFYRHDNDRMEPH